MMKIIKLVLLFMIATLVGCKEFKLEGIISLSIGEVISVRSSKMIPLKEGDIVTKEDRIHTSDKSIGEISFVFSDYGLEAYAISKLKTRLNFEELKSEKKPSFRIYLDSGKIQFALKKNKSNAKIEVVAPGLKLIFQKEDTFCEISALENGISSATITRGNAKAKVTVPREIQLLASEIRDARSFIEDVEKETKEINTSSPGISVNIAELKKKLEKAGLSQFLKEDSVVQKALRGEIKNDENSEEYKNAKKEIQKLKEVYDKNEEAKQVFNVNELIDILKLNIQNEDPGEFQKKIEEARSLTFLDEDLIKNSKNLKEAIQKRNEAIKPNLIKTLELVTEAKFQKIKLKNGREIEGVFIYNIENNQKKIFIRTLDGHDEPISKEDIDEIKFR